MYAPGIFQPYLKTLHHLLFSRSYWYVIFFFYPCTNSRRQTQKSKEEQKNSICNFLSIPPWLQTDRRIILASVFFSLFFFFIVLYLWYDCFWSWSQLYCLWCLHAVRLSPAPDVYILDIISGCPYSILGAQWSLFHFLCHNAIAQISLRGITLLEKRITYVVSQTHPSSPYPTGADDQWVCQCQGLRMKREGRRRRKRVFWKHVT